jgi:hypothetical protein
VIVAHACDVISGKAADAASAEPATHVASAKPATHVASAEPATHVASAEPATHVASADPATHVASAATTTHVATTATTTTTTASLCTRGKKAPGKHRACQNHHHSSSHDTLHFGWADVPPQDHSRTLLFSEVAANVTMNGRWECLSVVSIKFSFNQTKLMLPNRMRAARVAID